MLNFVLVVYVASSVASFQTVGPFNNKADCDGVKTQLAENFPDVKSACLAMTTASLQSIAAAKAPPKELPPKVIIAESVAPKPKVKPTAVPLPKPRPKMIVCPFKE